MDGSNDPLGILKDPNAKTGDPLGILDQKKKPSGGDVKNTPPSSSIGSSNSQPSLTDFTSKPDMYSPMMLTKAGREDYLTNRQLYHPDIPVPKNSNEGMRKPHIVAPLKSAPETFVMDETKHPANKGMLYNPQTQDYNKPDNTAYEDAGKKFEKEHPDLGSWNNALYRGGTALTEAVTKPLSSLAKISRDITGKLTPHPTTDVDSGAQLYNKDGSLTEYGKSVDAGNTNDPLGKLIIGLDAYGQETDKSRAAKTLPNTFLGNTASGLIDIAPDIAATTLFPEAKTAEATTTAMGMLKAAVNNPFTKWLAVKGGLNSYSEAEQKGETPGEATIEAGKGTIEGLASGAEMSLAGGVGAKVSNNAFKAFQDANLVAGNGILTKAGLRATADATIFAALPFGHAAVTSGINKLQGKEDDPEMWDNAMKEAQAGAGMGMGFSLLGAYEDVKKNEQSKTHINEILSDRQGIAVKNFMSATPEAIGEVLESPVPSGDMNAKAVEYAHKAQQEKDPDKKEQLVTLAQTFAKSSDVKGTTEAILHDKQGFIDGIESSGLADADKQELIDKINTIHKTFDPIEQQKTALGDKISELDVAITNNQQRIGTAVDPIEKADADVVGERLAKEKESLEKELRQTIQKQYEQKPAPLPEVTQEPSPKAPATNEAGEPEASVPVVNETVETPVDINHGRQKAIDLVTHGILGVENVKAGEIAPRLDFGMDAKERNKAVSDISKGNYDTAPAKKLLDKIEEFEKNGEYPIIEGTGGSTVRGKSISASEVNQNLEDAKQYKLTKESTPQQIDDINKHAKELGITHEDIQAYEQFRNETERNNGRTIEGTAEPLQRAENDERAGESQNRGSKAVQEPVGTKEIKTAKLEVNKDLSDNDIHLRAVEMPDGKYGIFQEVDGKVVGKSLGRSFDSPEALTEAYEGGIKDKLTAEAINKASEAQTPKEDVKTASEPPKEPEKPHVESAAVSIPYAKEFYEHDVKPALEKIGNTAKESLSAIVKALSPKTGVSTKAIDTITGNLNTRNEKAAALDKAVGSIEKMFDKMKDPERIDFIDKIKRGEKQPTKELQDIADMYRQLDKDLYDEVAKYRGALPFKEDHFRVLWEKIPGTNPETKERKFFGMSKRPLEGSKGFFKKATLVDMSEGIEKGGKPVSTNPMTLFKLAYNDAQKFVTANRMFDALKDDGFVKFVKSGSEAPEEFVKIKDKIANVYFPVKEGSVKAGEWYMEENAGRLVNNHLSQDLIRQGSFGRGLMEVKNFYTAAELGLSGYHASAIALEGVGSDIGRGFRKLVNLGTRGDFKAAGEGLMDILKAPFSPKTTFSLGRKYIKLASQKDFETSPAGKQLLKEMPDAEQYLHDFFMGGGLIHQSNDLKANTYKALKDNIGKDNYIGAALRAIPALNEMVLSPLFDTYIPAMKVGMFMKEFPLALKEQESRIASGKTTREAVARKTINFIDDRLGEMNFDNLFWDRTFKTSMQLMLRSVTWKLGNLRAMGGAPIEQAREFYNAAKENRAPLLEPKMAWVLGLATMQVALSSVTQYMFTGKPLQNVKDIIAPQIDPKDDKQRLILPTYVKDVMHLGYKGPVDYVKSSLAGDVSKLADVWQNSDFQKYQIYSPEESIWQNTKDITGYVLPKPISVGGMQKSIKQGDTPTQIGMSLFGLNKAPKYLTEPPIENKIFDLYNSHEGIKSKGQKEQDETKKEIRNLYKKGKIDDAERLANEAIEKGLLKITQINYLKSHLTGGSAGASHFFYEKLPEDDKVYLYNEMTEAERKEYDPQGRVAKIAEKQAAYKKKTEKPFTILK